MTALRRASRWTRRCLQKPTEGRSPTRSELNAQLAEQRAEINLLTDALNHVGRGVGMIDGSGRVVLVNEQAVDMLGVSAEFLATKPLFSDVAAMQWQSDKFKDACEELKARFRRLRVANQSERYRRQRPNGR